MICSCLMRLILQKLFLTTIFKEDVFLDKIIIFSDYGLDDAAALADIILHRDAFEKIDIVPIGGNVPTEVSLRNCLTLLGEYPYANDKITVVDTTDTKQPEEYLKEIHGNDGMGDVFEAGAKPEVKYEEFDEWLKTLSGDELVLSLGPMTMVKKLFEYKDTFRLVIMGGSIEAEPNFKGFEFNQSLDKEAFAYCTKFPHTAITLDASFTPALNIKDIHINGEGVYSQILNACQRISRERNTDGCYVWDDIAACFILHPERFKVSKKRDSAGNILNVAEYISDLKHFE